MSTISDLPIELFLKIIAMECEAEDISGSDLDRSQARRLKQFAVTAALVCRSWCMIVKSAPVNWITTIRLDACPDRIGDCGVEFTEAIALLASSGLGDLDIRVNSPWYWHKISTATVAERFLLHFLTQLQPFKNRIRRLEVFTRTFPMVLSAVEALLPLPSLAVFRLVWPQSEDLPSPRLEAGPYDDLFQLSRHPLFDFSQSLNCQLFYASFSNAFSLIKTPPFTRKVILEGCIPKDGVKWQDFTKTIHEACSHHLQLEPVHIRDIPSDCVAAQFSLSRTFSASLEADVFTICAIPHLLSMPSLVKLSIGLIQPPKDLPVQRGNIEKLRPLRLPALREFSLTVCNEWHSLHDLFVSEVLPRSLESVDITCFGHARVQNGCRLNREDRPRVSKLTVSYWHTAASSWYDFLTRWNPEDVTITKRMRSTPFLILPQTQPLLWENLHTLKLDQLRLSEFNDFYLSLNAPRLTNIEMVTNAGFLLGTTLRNIPKALRRAYDTTRSLVVTHWTSPTTDNLIRMLKSFTKLHVLDITMNQNTEPEPSHSEWLSITRSLEEYASDPSIASLTIRLCWLEPIYDSQAGSGRLIIRGLVQSALARIVGKRGQSDNGSLFASFYEMKVAPNSSVESQKDMYVWDSLSGVVSACSSVFNQCTQTNALRSESE
jgi:hypothetical protein